MWRVLFGSLCLALCIGLIGCTKPPAEKDKKDKDKGAKVDPKDAEKAIKDLTAAIEGNTYEKDKTAYTFGKESKFEYKGGDLTIKGTWKAVDGKNVEMTFKLTKEEVEKLKPAMDAIKALVDLANTAGETAAKLPGATAWTKIEAPSVKEGDNTWKESVVAASDKATINGVEYKKK